jgi:hypothetical protein
MRKRKDYVRVAVLLQMAPMPIIMRNILCMRPGLQSYAIELATCYKISGRKLPSGPTLLSGWSLRKQNPKRKEKDKELTRVMDGQARRHRRTRRGKRLKRTGNDKWGQKIGKASKQKKMWKRKNCHFFGAKVRGRNQPGNVQKPKLSSWDPSRLSKAVFTNNSVLFGWGENTWGGAGAIRGLGKEKSLVIYLSIRTNRKSSRHNKTKASHKHQNRNSIAKLIRICLEQIILRYKISVVAGLEGRIHSPAIRIRR